MSIHSGLRIIDINLEIEKLNEDLKNVKGKECEVYSRIVGYYRSTINWNKGKREEYNERKTFKIQNQ